MPMIYTCSDHPDWSGHNLQDVTYHINGEHGPNPWWEVFRRMGREFVPQVEAQGNRPLWIFACSRCGHRVETRTATVTICGDCRG